MITIGELKKIVDKKVTLDEEDTEVILSLSVDALEKLLEELKKGYEGVQGINAGIKILFGPEETPELYIGPDTSSMRLWQ